jgi:hypothetical protein
MTRGFYSGPDTMESDSDSDTTESDSYSDMTESDCVLIACSECG